MAGPGPQGGSPTGGEGRGNHYTYAQLMGLWINNGGARAKAPLAAAIAEAESSGWSGVTSDNPDGGTNVGLWQLDTKGKGAGHSLTQLTDPAVNARVAVAGSSNGQDWSAWETFTSGAYRRFLSPRTTPQTDVPTSGPTSTGKPGKPSACAWQIGWGGIPGSSFLMDIFGGGGNVGAGEVCVISKTQARALLGATLMGLGGAVVAVGLLGMMTTAAVPGAAGAAGVLSVMPGVGSMARISLLMGSALDGQQQRRPDRDDSAEPSPDGQQPSGNTETSQGENPAREE
jgi:Lysozyme like domain